MVQLLHPSQEGLRGEGCDLPVQASLLREVPHGMHTTTTTTTLILLLLLLSLLPLPLPLPPQPCAAMHLLPVDFCYRYWCCTDGQTHVVWVWLGSGCCVDVWLCSCVLRGCVAEWVCEAIWLFGNLVVWLHQYSFAYAPPGSPSHLLEHSQLQK